MIYQDLLPFVICAASVLVIPLAMAEEKLEPPWSAPPSEGKNFTVPGIDNVPDLHGDIINPDLVVFMGGNQFMVLPDLLSAFRQQYPYYRRIFVETLPPGILADQIEQGALIIGNMRIDIKPDVYTAGKNRIEQMQKKGLFERTITYTRNRLAIMVYQGNPSQIRSLQDLGRPEVRVSMPNPLWEGIGKQIIKSYEKAGGGALAEKIMKEKVERGTTFLTHIHHRQTPMRIMQKESDAGPVWYSEAYFQRLIGNPIEIVEIPEEINQTGTSMAAILKEAPHPKAAADFLAFLKSEKAQSVFKKYRFLAPEDK